MQNLECATKQDRGQEETKRYAHKEKNQASY